MADHDHAYKLLFSNAPLVKDLVQGFVGEEWVHQIDFSTLERVGDGYVTDDLRERENDVVWRLRWGWESWIYVYLLLEFQSTVDPSMAMRVLAYVSLLYQDLLRQGVRTPTGRLPPILPVVLYNGNRPWNAALDAEELIEEAPGGLGRHRPSLRYWLIDESRLSESELASEPDNLAAALFRLERGRRLAEINQDVATLGELLNKPEHRELRRAFAVWLSQVLLPSRLPGVRIPAVTELWEVKTMLVENTIDWTQEWKDLGREEGRQEALQILRPAVLTLLEQRFGPLAEETRRRVETIGSGEELGDLLKRVLSASSLADLGLAS
ncbi:MAG: Rpn family recombination-promoting nuclease/putative transposase [Thermoanaerobaculia bacterium]